MKQFNVIVYDFNSKSFTYYDVIPYLYEEYKKTKEKPKTVEEFKEFIVKKSQYQWWSRCEYEVILQSWPCLDVSKKIDVHYQVMMNIDTISEILLNECRNNKKE
jgi:hypothetical protein